MAKQKLLMPDLTAAQLNKLLVAKEKIEKLEARKNSLLSDLAKVEAEIEKVTASWQKGPKKKTTKKKAVKKAKGLNLEEIIIKTLGKRKMAFQDLLVAIQKNKQFASKSKNFANVLRRTLSTSKRVKRVGRGVYQAV